MYHLQDYLFFVKYLGRLGSDAQILCSLSDRSHGATATTTAMKILLRQQSAPHTPGCSEYRSFTHSVRQRCAPCERVLNVHCRLKIYGIILHHKHYEQTISVQFAWIA